MSALDPQQLSELIDLMGDDLGNLVEAFLRDSADRLQHLQRAVQQQDWDNARRQAHSLKGSSSNLGAVELAQRCQQLEALAAQGAAAATTMPTALQALETELATVQQELRQRFHS